MRKDLPQIGLIMEFFENNQNRDISHNEIVDWLYFESEKRTNKKFRDPDRGIRSLYQSVKLIKKGIYRYDPEYARNSKIKDFTQLQKEEILKKDNYKCVICGLGRENRIELHIDHIKPKEFGGVSEISNGQTLCSKHNMLKKTLNQTETGKKYSFIYMKLSKKKTTMN